MDYNTPGMANSYPKVGPIVINEIMYNPPWDGAEYVELLNITGSVVNLFDEFGNQWQFTDGIDFVFPSNTTIPAAGYLLVVNTTPADFRTKYPAVPMQVEILGPFENDTKLNNAGEQLEISMPGDIDGFGVRQYIRIDRVNYSDGSHPENCPGGVDLWPTEADGDGASLSRLSPQHYGNDPNNWFASEPPTPGDE